MPAATGIIDINGWGKIPLSGNKELIIQWGQAAVTKQGDFINLPIAFPVGMLQAVASDSGGGAYAMGTSGYNNTGIQFWVDTTRFSGGGRVICRFIAIGH